MIGIFDSGIGGISVLNSITHRGPSADCLYLADTDFFPYGHRTRDEIILRSLAVTEFLVEQGAGIIVVACNSATGAAIAQLRAKLSVPIVGIEPAIKVARRYLDRGPIGVLCTDLTSSGEKYRKLMISQGLRERVVTYTSPTLAAIVEEDTLRGEALVGYLERELDVFRRHRVGCLVLGCTHYAFVRNEIEAILGVPVLEPADAVAGRALALSSPDHANGTIGKTLFAATGPLEKVKRRAEQLLERLPVEWVETELPVPATSVT